MTAVVVPAKLTLSLRVLGTRPDGYHELEALTVSVDEPHDVLAVRPGAPGIRLTVAGEARHLVPVDDANLVVQTARRVLPDGAGLDVELTKGIPAGAGLGGGSADAAAMLRACAEVAGARAGDLPAVAAELGSDVPFCLQQGPAWMRGRGEIIDPVDLPAPLRVLVVVPPFAISTPAVYRAWDELGGPEAARVVAAPGAVAHLLPELANDLEPAAERVAPGLVPFRTALEAAAGMPALLAGSGSAYFVASADDDTWRDAAARVEADLSLPVHRGRVIPSGPVR